jgi:hypothetical protein
MTHQNFINCSVSFSFSQITNSSSESTGSAPSGQCLPFSLLSADTWPDARYVRSGLAEILPSPGQELQ